MKRLAILAAVAVILCSGEATQAQATLWSGTFVAIDAINVSGSTLSITGLREGAVTPVTVDLPFITTTGSAEYMASCQRLAMLAMARPGAYLLKYVRNSVSSCQLVRVTP